MLEFLFQMAAASVTFHHLGYLRGSIKWCLRTSLVSNNKYFYLKLSGKVLKFDYPPSWFFKNDTTQWFCWPFGQIVSEFPSFWSERGPDLVQDLRGNTFRRFLTDPWSMTIQFDEVLVEFPSQRGEIRDGLDTAMFKKDGTFCWNLMEIVQFALVSPTLHFDSLWKALNNHWKVGSGTVATDGHIDSCFRSSSNWWIIWFAWAKLSKDC